MDSPRRAAFLCTSTASFQPPDWACMPADSNLHARLEAFRDGRQCATYMVATQRVNLFGRDQESCDHVLGNPSVSRKHAAVIHDDEGGIYMVDLMSRHGTYVGRKKIPPHDPYLLHDGDVIRFGQSVRLYILKGASSNGSSAPVKKSWGHRLRVPHVNISAVVTKKSPGKPKASSAVIKLVNAVCYGSLKDEKVGTFLSGVLELGVKDRHGVADVLVERLQAKYEFYASHVHRNAFVATMALLKQNLCVQELEDNLDVFTHISQQRNDNIYRADARKLLQAIAAVRLDPDNPQFADPDTTEEDVGSACPPTANNREGRERSISEEGKKLSAHGMQLPYRAESVGTSSDLNSNHRERFGDSDIRHQTSNYKISNQHNDHDGDSDIIASCAPLSAIRCGMKSISVSSLDESVVNRIELPSSESTDPTGSAFTFISDSNPVNDDDSCASSTGQPFEHLSTEVISGSSTNAAEEFLLERPTVSGSEFALMWESANEELEEWSVEFGCVDAHELDPRDLESFLQSYRLVCVSSEKLAGQQQGAFIAEQKSEGTMFLVQISVMPGLTDMFVTLKWIVNSLLYRNGHIIFMKILKHALYQFAGQVQTRGNKLYTYSPAVSQKRLQSRSGREPDAMKAQSITYSVIHSASRTVSHATSLDDEEKVDDGDSGDEGTMLARNHLVESPSIDAGKFEEVWATAIKIASISFSLNEIPEVDEVIEHFRSNCLSCLASGSLDKLFKFFFFAEMTELQCVFCVELMIGVDSGNLEGTIKRLSIRKHSEDEEEQIDSSFVSFIENVLQELLSA
ncbi:hypothetical protein CCR75_004995 [Bremia lactucae]|uniref:FHA domain-containing protein n=1 Tax=Bremia lactucae TaxID=4779 RepID=A0A976FQR5_BRELC|nr:hypothetical protein CCR75_004995 [Bremia lactucae]